MVQIIDNPQALNPAQMAEMGRQFVAPVNDAIVRGGENAIRQATIASEQQFQAGETSKKLKSAADIATAHDKRYLDVAKERADSALKREQDQALNKEKEKAVFQLRRFGVTPPKESDFKTTQDYIDACNEKIDPAREATIKHDAAAVSAYRQRAEDLRNNAGPQVQAALDQFHQTAKDQTADVARGEIQRGLPNFVASLNDDNLNNKIAELQKQGKDSITATVMALNQFPALAGAFNGYQREVVQSSANKWEQDHQHQLPHQVAALNTALKGYDDMEKSLAYTEGEAGRGQVPKEWWGQVMERVNTDAVNKAQEDLFKQPSGPAGGATNPPATTPPAGSGAGVDHIAPPKVVQPAPEAGYDAQGNATNTAFFPAVGRFLRDATQPATVDRSLAEAGGNFTDQDRAAVAANPGFIHGIFSNPFGLRSLFDSGVPYGNIPPVDARYNALPMPAVNPALAGRQYALQMAARLAGQQQFGQPVQPAPVAPPIAFTPPAFTPTPIAMPAYRPLVSLPSPMVAGAGGGAVASPYDYDANAANAVANGILPTYGIPPAANSGY